MEHAVAHFWARMAAVLLGEWKPALYCMPPCLVNVQIACTQLPPGAVDVEVLHDATRREARGG